ncbi:Alpha-L-fucosidase 3 [Bienertia sinuspersici]
MSWWNSVNISRSVKATLGLKNRLQVVAVRFILLTGFLVFVSLGTRSKQILVLYPNGIAFFGNPYGRYCDGRLIIDFVGEFMLKSFLISLSRNLCLHSLLN